MSGARSPNIDVSERHESASESNSYAAVRYQGQLYFVSFWRDALDSIEVLVREMRVGDGYTFQSTKTACTFKPLDQPAAASELLLYCGLADANGKAAGVPSRCLFKK